MAMKHVSLNQMPVTVMSPRYQLTLAVALLLACCGFGTAYGQQEITLAPVKDNTLYENNDGNTSNGQGVHLIAGRTNVGTLHRALIAFDVAGTVPAGATIDEVELNLNVNRTQTGDRSVTLHRVEADWGEGASNASSNPGQGAPAATNDATWLFTFFNTTRWLTAGGDFASGPSASQEVGGPGSYTWGSSAGMVADVQAWLTTPETNFGWILIGDESANQTSKRFDSREASTVSDRPTLRIRFSVPTAVEDGEVPGAVLLAQNYPNPFERATRITYDLAAPQQVSLEVFDALGRRVATLVDGWQGAGRHQAAFDAGELPPGLYLYRLSTDHARLYKTMTLLR